MKVVLIIIGVCFICFCVLYYLWLQFTCISNIDMKLGQQQKYKFARYCFDPSESPSAAQHTWSSQLTRQNTAVEQKDGPYGPPSGWQGGPSVSPGGVQRWDKSRQRHRFTEREQFVHGERNPQQRHRVAEPQLWRSGERYSSEPEPQRGSGARDSRPARARAGRRGPETRRPRLLVLHQGDSRRRGWCSRC